MTIEEDVADTLHKIRHGVIGLKLDMATLLTHFGLTQSTDADVEAVLDNE